MSETVYARDESEARGIIARNRFLGSLGSIAPIAMLLGLIAMIILIATAGFRGAWILAKAFPLYPIVLVLAFIAMAFVMAFVRFLRFLAGLIAAFAVCYFGFGVVTKYYSNSERVFPAIYSHDFVQALPDGTMPKLHEKRNRKGAVVAELKADERVKVDGISFNMKEYRITTADGRSGWIGVAAFPEDAAEMLSFVIGLDGVDEQEIAADRQAYRILERYMVLQEGSTSRYALSSKILSQARKTDASVPILYLPRKAYKKGESFADVGVKIKISEVIYADDCTMVRLNITDNPDPKSKEKPDSWYIPGPYNPSTWQASLVVTDLDSGQKWQLMYMDYRKTLQRKASGNNHTESVVYFFPPFKTHHFSLTHEASALPDNTKKAGYGGILGFMASATGSGKAYDYYIDYDFPEVRVR